VNFSDFTGSLSGAATLATTTILASLLGRAGKKKEAVQ
jgi:hypothetical protein